MQLARIIGNCTSTVKHPSLVGWRMLIAQPLDVHDAPDGDPIVLIDQFGCGRGDRVMFTSDGSVVRQIIGADDSPVRFAVIGLADE